MITQIVRVRRRGTSHMIDTAFSASRMDMDYARHQPSGLEQAEIEVAYSAGEVFSAMQPRPPPTVEEVDLRSPKSLEAENGSKSTVRVSRRN